MNTKLAVATGTVCNPELFHFPAVKKRAFSASFTGGEVTSDGGLTLLRQTDRCLGLTKALAKVLPEPGRSAAPRSGAWLVRPGGLASRE